MIFKRISWIILITGILIMILIRFHVIIATPKSFIFILALGMVCGSLTFLSKSPELKKQ